MSWLTMIEPSSLLSTVTKPRPVHFLGAGSIKPAASNLRRIVDTETVIS